MDSITACLAENIRTLRKEKGLTQSELAEKAGISVIFLQGIESEKKWISPTTIFAIAKALRVPQARLFKNCFEEQEKQNIKRQIRANLDHIPNDVFNALATVCKNTNWQWETFRWILEGYQRSK